MENTEKYTDCPTGSAICPDCGSELSFVNNWAICPDEQCGFEEPPRCGNYCSRYNCGCVYAEECSYKQ